MPNKNFSIIEDSIHLKFILNCIAKGYNAPKIQQLLLEKGFKISRPTLRDYILKVKKQGLNINQFRAETESTALQVNEKIKSIKELSNIFNRRTYLIQTLLDRRTKVLDYANEGKRFAAIFAMNAQIIETLTKLKTTMKLEDYNVLNNQVRTLTNFCTSHFLKDEVYPQLEDTIRKYTMDIHELCKYIEQWTSKYEVEALMEKLCEGLTKAAVNSFGPLLKKETEEYRKQYINKFLQEVDKLMQDIRQYQLDLEER